MNTPSAPTRTRRDRAALSLVLGLVLVLWSEPAFSLQRSVRARIANYEEAPVSLRHASVQLVQTYSNPSQFPLAALAEGEEVKIKRSRVRYMNRVNQQIPTYLLEGELELHNHTRKEVMALEITTIFLNAFRERISMDQDSLTQSLSPYETKTIRWSRALPHEGVFEVFFVVTAIRFSNGEVWAPTEELILLP